MKLVEANLHNYKSITDAKIQFEQDITCLVGITGVGKTSILKLLEKVDTSLGFLEDDLPEKSKIKAKYLHGDLPKKEIKQLHAVFLVEDADRDNLPEPYRNASNIHVFRAFDNSWRIGVSINGGKVGMIDHTIDIKKYESKISKIFADFQDAVQKEGEYLSDSSEIIEEFAKQKTAFIDALNNNPPDLEERLPPFKSLVSSLNVDYTLQKSLNVLMGKLERTLSKLTIDITNDPRAALYDAVPHPTYVDKLPELTDRISLDDYLNNNNGDEMFKIIGIICGFNKSLLNKMRHQDVHARVNIFEPASDTLTRRFSAFWSQTKHRLEISIENGQDLVFNIRDTDMEHSVRATQKSEGIRWALQLFFKISYLLSSKGTSHILMLDSPATAVHDKGKEEIRKFMAEKSRGKNLQIIYTTHEKSLIDPWDLSKIRLVDRTRDDYTTVKKANKSRIDSVRIEISKHIGSPAKYSLFGAPVVVHFEGPSDYLYIMALNEYSLKTNSAYLDRDVYSVDTMNGTGHVKSLINICKSLELEHICIVDKNPDDQNDIKKLPDDYKKHILYISEVAGRQDADIEDLIDDDLFRHLFEQTYPGITVDRADREKSALNTVAYYTAVLRKSLSDENAGLDKTGIATVLGSLVKNPTPDSIPLLDKTIERFSALVKLINKRRDELVRSNDGL